MSPHYVMVLESKHLVLPIASPLPSVRCQVSCLPQECHQKSMMSVGKYIGETASAAGGNSWLASAPEWNIFEQEGRVVDAVVGVVEKEKRVSLCAVSVSSR